ncbi:MAG TPA: baseplate J/gp47 family protein [Anaerolineaceae bacterium]|nr:baseplate J/gp47 family protein [Anaerolineaceae bacterium]
MKTQIIQLEHHDDIVSTRDKMTWGKTPRLLLVWPEKERVLTRRLDLVLLQRHSRSLGAQLALVTGDPEVRGFAGELGIPCFNSVDRAQTVRWRKPRRKIRFARRKRRIQPEQDWREQRDAFIPRPEPAWIGSLPVRLVALFIGLAAVIVLVAALIPTAVIDLHPAAQIQEMSLPVLAGTKFQSVNLAGQIPLHWTTVVVEGQDTIPSTGKTVVPLLPASGRVSFTNLTDHAIEIPVGTVVQVIGQGPRYQTTLSARVSAGLGQSVEVPVQCLAPGRSGNLPANTIQAIEGPLGLSLTVSNAGAISGGRDQASPAPSSTDLALLREKLLKNLSKSAQTDLAVTSGAESSLLTPTIRVTNIASEKLDPPLNSPSDYLTLSLQAEFQAGYVDQDELVALANSALDAGLKKGYQPVKGSLIMEQVSQPVLDSDGNYRWRMRAQRTISPSIPSEQVVRQVAGLEKTRALRWLSSTLALQSPAVIRLSPPWWPWLPFLPFRIQVTTTSPG